MILVHRTVCYLSLFKPTGIAADCSLLLWLIIMTETWEQYQNDLVKMIMTASRAALKGILCNGILLEPFPCCLLDDLGHDFWAIQLQRSETVF